MEHTVLHYLERTAQMHPNKLAISDRIGTITFECLRRNALRLAAAVQNQLGGRTRLPVFVYLPKSKECITAFIGIVYSGNFYTPTDVRFPFPKVQRILDCLCPALIITDEANAAKLRDNGISQNQILLYETAINTHAEFDVHSAISQMIDTDPVYVFFTSGSTGVPKGVIINHRSIRDYTEWATETFSLSEDEVIGNQAPLYFDNSILDIYPCLKNGSHLHIIPESLFAFPTRLMQYVADQKINFIFWVPSALCHIANTDVLHQIDLSNIRKVLFCGEVMPNKQLNIWRRHLPDALFANLYGPTEITDVCTYYIVDRLFSDSDALPIGRPCRNTEILLLDANNCLITFPDIQGELCVRGTSLSLGYWNNPEKTAEAFVQNPLNPFYSENIYRTGDLAHYNNYGELMFDGRKDFQIKHLGHRIELGEIETVVLSLDGITAASADYDNNNSQIVLFYSSQDIGPKNLQKLLLGLLPKYMVPNKYVPLDTFPYNDNGKIDRKELRTQYIEVELI